MVFQREPEEGRSRGFGDRSSKRYNTESKCLAKMWREQSGFVYRGHQEEKVLQEEKSWGAAEFIVTLVEAQQRDGYGSDIT